MQPAIKKVVIGDRDAIVVAIVSHILQREGYAIHPVADPEELLELIRDGEYDAAILDALFEGVIDVVKAAPHRAHRIILTSPHASADEFAVHATLRKPLDFGELIDTVRNCVDDGQ